MHFALVVTYPALEFFTALSPSLGHYCQVDVLPVESNDHAYTLYLERWRDYDAFVFTGKVLMYAITNRIADLKRPCYAFDDDACDIREVILQLLLETRDFDFSRVFVDVISSRNNYLELRRLLPRDQWPYTLDDILTPPFNLMEGDVYEFTGRVLRRHLELHTQGKIDLSITRFGSIVRNLDEAGYPSVYLLPSKEYVVNFFLQLVAGMRSRTLQNQRMGAMIISFPPDSPDLESAIARVGAQVEEYAAKNGMDVTIGREKDTLRVLTRYTDLASITDNFSDSGFREGLLARDKKACVGLGIGHTMFQAVRNASSALELTQGDSHKVYYISEDHKVKGPLGQEGTVYHREPTEAMLRLADRFRVDHVYLQKIAAYTRLNQSSTVTADALADFLGVTSRTANRVLSKILAGGGALVYEENTTGRRGRPQKCYDLTFLDQLL